MSITFSETHEGHERPGPSWSDFLIGVIASIMIGLTIGVITLRLLGIISTPVMLAGLVLPVIVFAAIFISIWMAGRALSGRSEKPDGKGAQ